MNSDFDQRDPHHGAKRQFTAKPREGISHTQPSPSGLLFTTAHWGIALYINSPAMQSPIKKVLEMTAVDIALLGRRLLDLMFNLPHCG